VADFELGSLLRRNNAGLFAWLAFLGTLVILSAAASLLRNRLRRHALSANASVSLTLGVYYVLRGVVFAFVGHPA